MKTNTHPVSNSTSSTIPINSTITTVDALWTLISQQSKAVQQALAQRLANVVGQSDYYDSEAFYKDIDEAEQDIANGKGTLVSNIQDLDKLFA